MYYSSTKYYQYVVLEMAYNPYGAYNPYYPPPCPPPPCPPPIVLPICPPGPSPYPPGPTPCPPGPVGPQGPAGPQGPTGPSSNLGSLASMRLVNHILPFIPGADPITSLPPTQSWSPYQCTVDTREINETLPFSPSNTICPTNTYEVYLSKCDFSPMFAQGGNPFLSSSIRALKMCPSGVECNFTAFWLIPLAKTILDTCDRLICWVYDPTGAYQQPVHVTIYALSVSTGGSLNTSVTTKMEWTATANFLQHQTLLDPFATQATPPLWIDGAGATGTIGSYAGQPGVPGGRILLISANNTT